MKMRTHRHKIQFPIFGEFHIRVSFVADVVAESKKLSAEVSPLSIAYTVLETGKAHIVLAHHADAETIAHEAFHAVWALMKYVGAELEDEVVAYHLGHVVGLITKWGKRNAA